jgi:hypothetical protein
MQVVVGHKRGVFKLPVPHHLHSNLHIKGDSVSLDALAFKMVPEKYRKNEIRIKR